MGQCYRPIELILVDDGSTDDTYDVFLKWRTQNIDCDLFFRYLTQTNKGGNAARNAGIRVSEGEFVAFLDSDDCWDSSKLDKQYNAIHGKLNMGAVYCGVRHTDYKTGKLLESADRSYPQGRLLDQLLVKDVTAQTSAWLIRKCVFDRVGLFDTELMARQDWDMWIRISTVYEIGAVPLDLVDFREHPGPRTASDPQREIDAYTMIMAKYASLRESRSFSVRQSAVSAYHRRLGRVTLHHKLGRGESLARYLYALTAWPFDFDNYAALAGWFLPAGFRSSAHRFWNRLFGKTVFAIRSH